MDYLSDQSGIIDRYLGQSDQWEDHLEKTSAFILKSLADRHPGQILILGSGWLLDVPLEEIYSCCRNVTLVDIYHPPQVIHKIRKYPGIIPVYADITGGLIKDTYDMVKQCRKTGTPFDPGNLTIRIPDPGIKEKDVYVISLNILDQLDSLIRDYINRWFVVPSGVLENFRARIQEAHVSMVSAYPFCIIADDHEILFNSQGEERQGEKLLLTTLPGGNHEEEWTWKFDNHFGYNEGYKTWFRVKAVSC